MLIPIHKQVYFGNRLDNDQILAELSFQIVNPFWRKFGASVKANRQATWLIYTANNTLKETVIASTQPPRNERNLNKLLDASVDGHVLLFFNNLRLLATSQKPRVVPTVKPTDETELLTPTVLVQPNIIDYAMNAPPYLNFRLRSNAHSWHVQNVTIAGVAVRSAIDIRAPHMHSYTCPTTIRFVGGIRDDDVGVVYELRGLRLQPNFGDYMRGEMVPSQKTTTCIGYFTVGILSVLMVGGLLLVALFVVIGCLLDIQACDRFDKR